MKKTFAFLLGLSMTLSACMPGFLQPTASPAPTADMQATSAVLAQATLQALPTPTVAPSNTPVIATPSVTNTLPPTATPTETVNPVFLTLTATLGTGTAPVTPSLTPTGTLATSTPSTTPNPFYGLTPTETLHPQHYGTMPPNLPFGKVTLVNKSKVEAYISLQCTTKEGYVTIIEYPVQGTVEAKAPAGNYIYVAWVGGRKMEGKFGLDKSGEVTIRIFKDRIEVKN
jgi:hypothetical protein